jgi:DNA-binding NarL/FixJ family response regulator
MNIVVLTPVRLLGDGLAACFSQNADMRVVAIVANLAALRERLFAGDIQAALVDVTQGVPDLRDLSTQFPNIPLVALGLNEQRQDVVQCGRAGFAGYIARDASVEALQKSMRDIVAGRLTCPPEIASGLLRALFRGDERMAPSDVELDLALTRRESEVLELLGQGLSNKEIGSELCLSVATVKHHVHHVLEKMKLPRRAQAMRKVREAPWLARSSAVRR